MGKNLSRILSRPASLSGFTLSLAIAVFVLRWHRGISVLLSGTRLKRGLHHLLPNLGSSAITHGAASRQPKSSHQRFGAEDECTA